MCSCRPMFVSVTSLWVQLEHLGPSGFKCCLGEALPVKDVVPAPSVLISERDVLTAALTALFK